MRKHSFAATAGLILPLLVLCVCAFGFLLAPNDPDLVDLCSHNGYRGLFLLLQFVQGKRQS